MRLRGTTTFDVSPSARLGAAEIEAYWSASQNVDWDADLIYDFDDTARERAPVLHSATQEIPQSL